LIIGSIWLIIALVINRRETNSDTFEVKKSDAPAEKTEVIYKNITCKVVQKTPNYIRITTSEMLKDSDLLQVISQLAVPDKLVYFHLPDYVGASQEYGSVMNGSPFVIGFDASKMKKQTTPDPIKQKKTSIDDPEFARKAFVISMDFIKQNLTSPKSADFPLLDYKYSNVIDNTIVIESYVDAKNSYGTEVRQNYSIKLKFKGGEWEDINNWTLIDLQFTGQ